MKSATTAKALIAAMFALCFVFVPSRAEAENKPAEEGPKVERPKVVQERYDIYIHKWLKMPDIVGRAVGDRNEQFEYKPVRGRGTVVIFLSASCLPCQEQMENLRRIEARYNRLFTDFIYVFVNDSSKDALAFAKEYGIGESKLVHGTFELLKAYKNPPLPSIYIGDRHGWIGSSYLSLDTAKVEKVNHYLKLMTAF